MNVMRPFQGVDDLHIHHVADDVVLVGDPIGTMHVTT